MAPFARPPPAHRRVAGGRELVLGESASGPFRWFQPPSCAPWRLVWLLMIAESAGPLRYGAIWPPANRP